MPEYVIMLRKMVKQHLGKQLMVLGDQGDADIEVKHHKGWHAKLELFRPEFSYLRPFLYFDLDTYIMEDSRELLINPDELYLIRDFNISKRGNSGVMIIPKETDKIWENRTTDVADGDYLNTQQHKYINDFFPHLRSYKNHCKEGPEGKVICFHGQPKPDNVQGWAGDVWTTLIH